MSASVSGEEQEATELLDETQRLRQKRDLLTKENEQLKTYLRLRQMESTSTCEQLKSEIEQQIEQFEALGDQSFSDSQTSHLETLKSFRSEIEAIQCWNAKIRNKYFSRNTATEESARSLANQLTDELIEQMVASTSVRTSERSATDDRQCDNESNVAIDDTKCEDVSDDRPKLKKSIKRKVMTNNKKVSSEEVVKDVDNNAIDNNIKTRLRSKHSPINSSSGDRPKRSHKKEDNSSQKTSKRRRK